MRCYLLGVVLLGTLCSLQAFGVLGSSCEGSVEVEGEPGVSLTLAALPGEVRVQHNIGTQTRDEGGGRLCSRDQERYG